MEFFDQSYQNLKEYLGYYLETDTAGLTADEVKEEMQRIGATSDVSQKVGKDSERLRSCLRIREMGLPPTRNPRAASRRTCGKL